MTKALPLSYDTALAYLTRYHSEMAGNILQHGMTYVDEMFRHVLPDVAARIRRGELTEEEQCAKDGFYFVRHAAHVVAAHEASQSA